jgi:hypothetical protein
MDFEDRGDEEHRFETADKVQSMSRCRQYRLVFLFLMLLYWIFQSKVETIVVLSVAELERRISSMQASMLLL